MKRIGMKTGIKVAALALLLPLLLTSCKKDFTCTCTSTDVLGNTRTDTYPLSDQTRPDAVENCENFEREGAWATRNCNL